MAKSKTQDKDKIIFFIMASNSSSRRSNRGKLKSSILLSDISYSSNCVELDLPLTLCCDRCQAIKEAECGLLKKSSHSSKRFCETSERRRYQQPWASINGECNKTLATSRKFVRARNYLNIDCNVEIKTGYDYDNATKKNKQSDDTPIV